MKAEDELAARKRAEERVILRFFCVLGVASGWLPVPASGVRAAGLLLAMGVVGHGLPSSSIGSKGAEEAAGSASWSIISARLFSLAAPGKSQLMRRHSLKDPGQSSTFVSSSGGSAYASSCPKVSRLTAASDSTAWSLSSSSISGPGADVLSLRISQFDCNVFVLFSTHSS